MSNIEDKMFPENGILQRAGEELKAIVVDAELDPIECKFSGDSCIDLQTKDVTYLKLSIDNLKTMIKLIKESEK